MASLMSPPYMDVGAGLTPADGAKLYFYVVGSATPKDSYTTAAATVAHANPVVSDAKGVFPAIYITGDYDWVLQDKNSVQRNTGSVSQFVTGSGQEDNVLNRATLAAATADVSMQAGLAVNLAERTTGNGGGGMWDVIAGTGTANGLDKVAHDTLSLTFVMRNLSEECGTATVAAMVATDLIPGQSVKTVGYYDGWSAVLEPAGGANYTIATLAEVRAQNGDGAWVPDEWVDHTLANGNVAMCDLTGGIETKQAGAKVDGSTGTDDVLPIQAAINKLCQVTLSRGTSKVTAQVDVPIGASLLGYGRQGGDASSVLYASHTGNAGVNLSGAGITNSILRDFRISTDPANYPKTGILAGRTTGASAGHHNVSFLRVEGRFSVAAIYEIASEVNTFSDMYVLNGAGGGKYCFYTAASDDLSVAGLTTSTNLAANMQSMYLINESTDPDAANIYMESSLSMGGWDWFSTYMVCTAGAYLHINNKTDTQCLGPYSFYGLKGEIAAGGSPMYGVRITSDVGTSFKLNSLNIHGNRFDLPFLTTTTGSDDTSTAAEFMTNSAASYTVDQFVDMVIENETDGSYAVITANTATTITGALRGGTNNNWDSGDTFTIYNRYSLFMDSNVTLTQPNVVMHQPEAISLGLYAQHKYDRNKIQGGVFSVGRDGVWTTATLLNSWVNSFGGPPNLQASYSIDATGNVSVRGLVSSGAGTIMTLPKYLRPASNMYFSTSGNGAYARLLVNSTTGAVTLDAGAGPQVDLNAISFRKGG